MHQNTDIVKFIFYTLGISEDMMNKKEAGKITTHLIINLQKNGLYNETKNSLLEIAENTTIDLVPDKFFTFCVLIDFTSRCFISDVFSEKLRLIHEQHPFDTNATFDEMKSFYLKYATKYFNHIKKMYKEEKWVEETISKATDWIMNDEDFC